MSTFAAPKEFVYLVPSGKGASVGDKYTLKDISDRVVVRDELNQKYLVFESWDQFWAFNDAQPPNFRCFHEVIFGSLPQRAKFDIDAALPLVAAIDDATLKILAARAGVRARDDTDFDDLLQELGIEPDKKAARAATPEEALIDQSAAKMDVIIRALVAIIADEMTAAYYPTEKIATTSRDIVVAESSGPDKTSGTYKFSYHILVGPYAIANNEEAKALTRRVVERLPPAVARLVDQAVNKSVQNFRLPGSAKPGSGRVKAVTGKHGTPRVAAARAAVRDPALRVLGPVRAPPPAARPTALPAEIPEGDLKVVLKALADDGALDGHRFSRAEDNLLLFLRARPSHCRLCGRRHDNDNTLMVSVAAGEAKAGASPAAPAPHSVLELCRHAPGASRLVAVVAIRPLRGFDVVKAAAGKGEEPKQALQAGSVIERRIKGIAEGSVDPHRANTSKFEQGKDLHVYSEPQMRPYEVVPTLVVKAQMKLGKTKALRAYVDREFPAQPGGLAAAVIRMVTFRQTFSKSMHKEAFSDFSLYSDFKGDLNHVKHPRLIVQVESLHRLTYGDTPEPVDLLVLDEVESILGQFESGLHRHFNADLAMFRWMVATAGRVICMDANVSDRTHATLADLRAHAPPRFHWNQFRRAEGDLYRFTADQATWLDHLYAQLDANKKVVVPMNSIKEAEVLEKAVAKRYPGRRVRLYSSKTLQSEKNLHFGDVHKYWGSLDVLIYTPTVSAGVSFELEHFDVLFGHFSDRSCGVETCRQMLGRVRNLRSREHFLLLRGVPANLPTSTADIERLVHDQRAGLYRKVASRGAFAPQFDYTAGGRVQYYSSPYFRLWLESLRIENLSKNAFVARFIDQVADTGAAVAVLKPRKEAALLDVKAEHKQLKAKIANDEAEAVRDAEDIFPDEAMEIQRKMSDQEDVTAAERLSYAKYRLQDTYSWHGREMTTDFVKNYKENKVARVYRNLTRVFSKTTLVKSLKAIQRVETDRHTAFLDAVGGETNVDVKMGLESHDLHHRYVYRAHYFALWLLHICGFASLDVDSGEAVHTQRMYDSLKSHEKEFLRQQQAIAYEFKKSPAKDIASVAFETDPGAYVKRALAVVNPVLRTMYGRAVIRAVPHTANTFSLSLTYEGRLFVYGDEPDLINLRPNIRNNVAGKKKDAVEIFMDNAFYENIEEEQV